MSGSSDSAAGDQLPIPEVRAAAARLVDRVLSSGQPSTALLESARGEYPARDVALLRELVLGTLRWLRRLDHVAEEASGRTLGRIDRRLRSPLRVGLYQLLFLDRVPDYAAVDLAVTEARRRRGSRAAGFVNAVLRRVAGSTLADWPVAEESRVRRLGIEHSHPDLLVAAWLGRLGEPATVELMTANNRPRGAHLLSFRDRGGRGELQRALASEGVETAPCRLSRWGLEVTSGNPIGTTSFERGDLYVQDVASQAAAVVVPPRPKETILDAAAAPGGKTFSLLAWEPACRPTAMELRPGRLRTLQENARRLGRSVPMVGGDASCVPFRSTFDRVVLDLPCTGTGTLRKHPELKWRVTEDEIERLARIGLELMTGVAGQVGDDGLLQVITCSIEPRENERVVDEFVERHPSFSLLPLEPVIPVESAGGIESRGRWRLLPAAGNDGFTVHVLARR